MSKDSPQKILDELQAALQRLKSIPLPQETKIAIHQATRLLAELPHYLEENVEQTRLAALYRVSHSLGTTLDVDSVLTQVMDAVIGLTNAERGFLMLPDTETNKLRLRAARNIEQETLQRKDMEVSRTVINTVMRNGVGLVTTDAQSDPRFANQDSVIIYALHSIMCAPLRARGQVIGVIYVDNRAQSGIFTDKDLDMLNAFATQAAIAIENARLYTRTDQALAARVAELETLTNIDQELNARLDLDHVTEITRHWAIRGTSATQGWVILVEEDHKSPRIAAGPGEKATFMGGTLIAQTIEESKPQLIPPIDDTPARLFVPIPREGGSIGLIVAERSSDHPLPFTEADSQFLTRLTGRAAIAIENARLYEAVQQANQAKSKFISVVTHELRIPMTSIKGYTDLIRQEAIGPINDQQANFLNVIRKNVERMSTLVSDLSDISRIETGRLKLEADFLSLHSYVEETLRSLRPELDGKSQTLVVNVPTDLPKVYADPNRLEQVLANLVSNASKYTEPGGKITIHAHLSANMVRTEVTDTGIGINPQEQAYLFSQFFRSEHPTVREQQGWGLGLSVAKRLVELMNGEIGMRSTLGVGSTFWFTLPISMPET